jgi:coenzyme F420-reducing hydrogenase delta subunit-like protein
MPYPEIVIAGCGNPLFADDGFGPVIAEELQKLSLPDNVMILDAGLGGPHFILASLNPDVTKKVIIVCASNYGKEPGTIIKLRVEDLPPGTFRDAFSWDLVEPLKRFKNRVDITIIGCQPARIPNPPNYEIGLSEELQKAIPKTILVILELIGVDDRNAFRRVELKPQTDFVQKNIKPWAKGYKILNRYEIIDIKRGGMGIVYIAHDHDWDQNFAIKTFQDKYLWDENVIQRFMEEAETWTKLERHTNIVFANFVTKIEGKPLLFLEYIDSGDLSQLIGKLSIEETLDFAIQFCTGMEYAYQKLGVIHRDIKPGNVMVQTDPNFRFGYAFKITDFGLVKSIGSEFQEKFVEISSGMGTLPFMPPEQFPDQIQKKFSFKGQVTTRSDIYSFGITLYLLLTGKLPFNDLNEIITKYPEPPKNLNSNIPENFNLSIIKCLEKNPDNRYADFSELKVNLIEIYNILTGENYDVIGKKVPLIENDWNNKGVALNNLGKSQESIECYNKALVINPRYIEVWNNKGNALISLGKLQQAIECFDSALVINPRYFEAWNGKGNALYALRKFQEAIESYDKALVINPRDFEVWNNKGNTLISLGKLQQAIECFDKTLVINPRSDGSWVSKGNALANLGKLQQAIECDDSALVINPRNFEAWYNKGVALKNLGKPHEAIECYEKALEINPKHAMVWKNKGGVLTYLGDNQDAIRCFEKFIEFAPPEYASQVEQVKQIINQLR